jgi:threonine/homoserine/homoserine lactone efflux protein
MIIMILAEWLVSGTSIAAMLREPRRARVVNAALALVLNECACAYCASIKRHHGRLS